MKISKKKLKAILKELLFGEKYYSIIFYLIVFYIVFSYLALPAIYAFSPVSYISSVVSGSMEHLQPTIQMTYYDWLSQHGFNSSITVNWPFADGIDIGSLVVAYKVPQDKIKVGDVIIYRATYNGVTEEVIHRVINETVINGTYYYTTKGDANPASLPFEINVPYSEVIGRVDTLVPYLGYPRYLLYAIGNLI